MKKRRVRPAILRLVAFDLLYTVEEDGEKWWLMREVRDDPSPMSPSRLLRKPARLQATVPMNAALAELPSRKD